MSDEEVKQFFQHYGPVIIIIINIYLFIWLYNKLQFVKVKEFKMMYDDVKKRPRGKKIDFILFIASWNRNFLFNMDREISYTLSQLLLYYNNCNNTKLIIIFF